ncbi:hypothetical protein YC2023_017608 [Brassica napus]
MGIVAAIGVLLPFPFYWWLWTNPQSWVNLCGQGKDPSTVMARVSHVLKAAQLLSLFSVASLSWPPPLYFWPVMAFGQFLNFRSQSLCPGSVSVCWIEIESKAVYQLLGEAGTYYGVRFGKNIPWVTEFPFGVIRDPQYVGSVMSLLACLSWVPFQYIFLWCLGYVFMMLVESKEDPSARAKPIS